MIPTSHEISYTYRSYRCRWHCSCGESDKSYTVAKYFQARDKANKHLEKVTGELNNE